MTVPKSRLITEEEMADVEKAALEVFAGTGGDVSARPMDLGFRLGVGVVFENPRYRNVMLVKRGDMMDGLQAELIAFRDACLDTHELLKLRKKLAGEDNLR